MSKPELSKFLKQDILENIIRKDINDYRKELDDGNNLLYITPEILQKNSGYDLDLSNRIFDSLKNNIPKHAQSLQKKFTQADVKKKVGYRMGPNYILLLGPSFSSVQINFSKAFKTKEILNMIPAEDRRYKTVKNEQGVKIGQTEVIPFEVGHVGSYGSQDKNTPAGAKIARAKNTIDLLYKGESSFKGISSSLKKFIKELEEAHLEFDALTVKDRNILGATKRVSGKMEFIFTVPQLRSVNSKLATIEKRLVSKVEEYIKDRMYSLPSSKTFFELVNDYVIAVFQDIKSSVDKKNYHSTAKTKGSKKVGSKVRKQKPAIKLRDSGGKFTSLINIQTLMNLRLHDQVRSNMGKGGARQILNYRTGRFAESAEITALQQRSDRIIAFYTYMRSPYDVFLPGGRLHKPGRDPRKIISRSIRQLATQLISNRMKVYPQLGDA